jgi:alpha-glucosidase
VGEDDTLLFVRASDHAQLLVALNMGAEPLAANLPAGFPSGPLLLSSFLDRDGERIQGGLDLRPHEEVLIDISRAA